MKSLLSASVLVCLLLAVAATDALQVPNAKFANVKAEAADFAALTVPQYVARLEEALRHAPENRELLQHVHYYRSVGKSAKASVRDGQKGTVHDCLPFELQPPLFEASTAEVREARANWLSATLGGLSSAEAVCVPGTVPIPRPVVRYAGGSIPKLSSAPLKAAPKGHVPKGYSYVDSAFVNTSADTKFSYTILGVGKQVKSSIPSTPSTPFSPDHSINQMWWVDQNLTTHTLDTLEAGWIHSSYWSMTPQTMLFVFSTPNGYNASTPAGQAANQYNFAGGFIGYPGAPALQKGVDSVMYMWKWEVMVSPTNNSVTGFAQKLTPFSVGTDGNYTFGTEIPLGYYPVGRYANGQAPKFSVLQTGQEMSENTNSSTLKAGGKIFGWGTNAERFNVLGNFTNFGQKMNFTYGTKPNFVAGSSPYPANHWVAFHGDDCGNQC